ncbi:hypothetical protein SAMN04488096_10733 [Mesonia phycicola]|uniref:Uncharacterized protein n=1 Tax=Mesonia phycicola TaxID=579105 RepID=A0A1M6FYV1_9FLAO|nr:hypothetical protein [Mesonia phycicola]SHJ02935.1 hypothetical protein SAMN04488096_10733 [Mesonia phycicola]
MEWLEKKRPPLIFRSLYYGFYKLAIKTNNSTPRLTASLSMAFTHLIQVLFLIDILRALKVIDVWALFFNSNGKLIFGVFAIVFYYIVDAYYSYRNKHLKYGKEIELKIKSNSLNSYVYIYLFITFLLLIFSFWSLTLNNSNYV